MNISILTQSYSFPNDAKKIYKIAKEIEEALDYEQEFIGYGSITIKNAHQIYIGEKDESTEGGKNILLNFVTTNETCTEEEEAVLKKMFRWFYTFQWKKLSGFVLKKYEYDGKFFYYGVLNILFKKSHLWLMKKTNFKFIITKLEHKIKKQLKEHQINNKKETKT